MQPFAAISELVQIKGIEGKCKTEPQKQGKRDIPYLTQLNEWIHGIISVSRFFVVVVDSALFCNFQIQKCALRASRNFRIGSQYYKM